VRLTSLVQDIGKLLVFTGLALAVVGAVLWFCKGLRLPGDIFVERGNFSFAFPIVTCIVISIVLTILFNIFRR
jgi:hypothetical protein